ncbi:hypothetical protein GH810_14150 [Acetobacterium paludosum]|uniref:Uncharacterized protein n=2 Tax=Acetobacterium TaxID=33951 RepID=A0A923I3U9_9FIRM|nr:MULTISPECIES: hypothetical protein [Acetobacterium]MBC3798556.1 hypothetical protein [Acetobacterium tundrae]MBC3889453.1 hypothetical protein [Acetobacterium paludosum]
MDSNNEKKCSQLACSFNENGRCPDMDVLRNPWRQTGCIFFTNKNVRTDEMNND